MGLNILLCTVLPSCYVYILDVQVYEIEKYSHSYI